MHQNHVVCTANLDQKVSMKKLSQLPCGIYDEAIYGGRCGYDKFENILGLNQIDECDSQVKKVLQHKEQSCSTDDEFIYVKKFGNLYLK